MSEYFLKLQNLQKEFKEIDKRRANKWEFKPHQRAIFDFVMKSKKYVVFNVLEYEIVLRVGNERYGFKHFLLRHYGDGCEGEIKALDILNIGNVVRNNIVLPAKDKKRVIFMQNKGGLKYSLVLEKRESSKLVVSFFSSE